MPPDPNAKLIKAIEGLTRSVDENTKQVKEIVKNTRSAKFPQHPYLDRSREVEDAAGTNTENTGPYGSGTSQPYS